ncbi:MAG: PHP domain-containing protein [Deltaproteobacteria bacterium]|nr:PHP domain-containing protein [Deltaproteobacteria bacterium]
MKGGLVDLHIHTTASSDGQHSPEEIFKMATLKKLKAIAFADHNSVDSIDEGLQLSKRYKIELIPCFELNTIYDGMDLHLLAYFIEYKDPAFHEWLHEIHDAKKEQALDRLKALQDLDFPVSLDDLERAAKGQIPSGSTFMTALLRREEGRRDPRLKPYIDGDRCDSPSLNFYRDYFRKGKPAFVPLKVCPTEEGIEKIRQFGGVPVQAHPSDTGDERISELIDAGLMGLEAYSSYHTPEESEHFRQLAQSRGIIATSGSDFHGKRIKPNVEMASVGGNSYEIVERLKDAKRRI